MKLYQICILIAPLLVSFVMSSDDVTDDVDPKYTNVIDLNPSSESAESELDPVSATPRKSTGVLTKYMASPKPKKPTDKHFQSTQIFGFPPQILPQQPQQPQQLDLLPPPIPPNYYDPYMFNPYQVYYPPDPYYPPPLPYYPPNQQQVYQQPPKHYGYYTSSMDFYDVWYRNRKANPRSAGDDPTVSTQTV